ncbi:MAG: bestrophin family ion channel [Chitinophagaceae bacterium]
MHTGKRYTPWEFFRWTRQDVFWLLIIAAIPTTMYAIGLSFVALPWQPVAIVGTAVAFIVGFKNNASYNRLWEARQIYGSIINDSRSLGYTVRDVLQGKSKERTRVLFNRHIAWLTALRYQLREPRPWENMKQARNLDYKKNHFEVSEQMINVETALGSYLSKEELSYVLSKKNRATQLIAMQSAALASIKSEGHLNDFQWTQLQQILMRLTDHQGKAERIKNFPYPRNFSSIATYLLFLFILLAPFGLLREMDKLGDGTILQGYTIWLNIPFSALIAWAFHTLDTVGESSMNPFEGNANDVPITQISRTIEIDLLDMLDDEHLPPAIVPVNDIVL